MMESYSDWEYYSDDYYDDDPTVLRAQAGAELRGNSPVKKTKPARRSKLPKTDDIPELDIGSAMASRTEPLSRGVVWREASPEGPLPYETCDQEKVALLKNWREVFKHSNPRLVAKRKTSEKLSRQRDGVIDAQRSSPEIRVDPDEEPPQKRKKVSGKKPKGRAQLNDVAILQKSAKNAEAEKAPNQPQSKKRKAAAAAGAELSEMPPAKRAVSSKIPSAAQDRPQRATRSRKK